MDPVMPQENKKKNIAELIDKYQGSIKDIVTKQTKKAVLTSMKLYKEITYAQIEEKKFPQNWE